MMTAPRFTRAPHVQQVEQAGAIVLFDGEHYYTLPNETANSLWTLLAEPRSAEEIANQLHDEYDAPRDLIAADTAAHLLLLRRKGLVLATGLGGAPLAKGRPWWLFRRRG